MSNSKDPLKDPAGCGRRSHEAVVEKTVRYLVRTPETKWTCLAKNLEPTDPNRLERVENWLDYNL